MLHELLLALSGDSGGVFVHKKFAGLQVCGFSVFASFGANIFRKHLSPVLIQISVQICP